MSWWDLLIECLPSSGNLLSVTLENCSNLMRRLTGSKAAPRIRGCPVSLQLNLEGEKR